MAAWFVWRGWEEFDSRWIRALLRSLRPGHRKHLRPQRFVRVVDAGDKSVRHSGSGLLGPIQRPVLYPRWHVLRTESCRRSAGALPCDTAIGRGSTRRLRDLLGYGRQAEDSVLARRGFLVHARTGPQLFDRSVVCRPLRTAPAARDRPGNAGKHPRPAVGHGLFHGSHHAFEDGLCWSRSERPDHCTDSLLGESVPGPSGLDPDGNATNLRAILEQHLPAE